MTISADDLLALEARRCQALLDDDFTAIDELFCDEVLYTHSSGSMDTKASYVASLRSGALRYRSITRHDPQVLAFDGAAVIATGITLEITANGTERTINGRATITWVRDGGAWRFAAWQSTPVAAH